MCEALRVDGVIEAHQLHQVCGFRQAAMAAAAVVAVEGGSQAAGLSVQY